MNVEEYISSGIVESYVLGITDEKERLEFERLLPRYPQLQSAMQLFEVKLEREMLANAVPPPAYVWGAIENRVRKEQTAGDGNYANGKYKQYRETVIPIVSESTSQIRVHKNFRYAFIALVILSKVFLYGAIYYYLAYKDELKQRERLEQQMQQAAPSSKPVSSLPTY